ncbi:GGDEF domain-containing protein [Roseibium salinum]|nr:GGDEF domain-containing protein [Roseibium salinum]
MQIVSERLKAVFDNHLVARLSGDEFAVLITTMSDPARMTRLAADMIAATGAPCLIDGREIKLSLSIGIARATDGSWRSSRLLHCADLALYRAKHSGRSTFFLVHAGAGLRRPEAQGSGSRSDQGPQI